MRRDYGPDVLAAGAGRRQRAQFPEVPAERGLVVEEAGGDFCGAVIDCEKHVVTLEDRWGRQRVFPLTRGGFLLEGRAVTLIRPVSAGPGGPGGPGVLQALGWAGGTAAGWRRILGAANSYTDLEPALLGRVEELIDFVTAPGTGAPGAGAPVAGP